jgi:uncharacterized membrane protein YccC
LKAQLVAAVKPSTPASERLHDVSLRQGQVKHALKTALACCLAAGLAYWFRLPSGQFAPLFAYLLLTLGMPSPRLNWLLAQLTIVLSALVSAFLLVAFGAAPLLHLAVTLLWIFFCLLFINWFTLPADLGAMVSALGIFVFLEGTVGDTLSFYVAYGLNFLVAGLVVLVIHTLLWPLNAQAVFLERLAAVYASLEEECRQLARRIRAGEPAPPEASRLEWAPFRPLRQSLAPELRTARDTTNPFARMILACRALNLRLWFFGQAVAPAMPRTHPPEVRRQLASHLDQCADQLQTLLDGALLRKQVSPLDARVLEVNAIEWHGPETMPQQGGSAGPFAHGIPQTLLHRLTQDLQTVSTCHNALLGRMRVGLAGELVALSPVTTGTRLVDGKSLRAATKLVLLLLLLLAEEAVLGFPGGTQVAFFAVFFASTGNLGRQNKTDLIGLAGILAGITYGVVAAFLTSRLLGFPLLLALVFLGAFLANLAYQKLPRYGVAGLQAGLAIPFAYLATPGPEWGSFTAVWTRFAGLAVAGATAVVVHAYLWPVLPMRNLRALIATALRDTARSLGHLFAGPPRSRWEGSPPSLGETVTRARDLLDDARYLPGPEHTDPAYLGILGGLQEIDANLEYVRILLSLEPEHALRERFFQVVGDYAEQARRNLGRVAQQFQPSPRRAAAVEPIRWEPDASGRWERASREVGPVPDRGIDPWRPAVLARCLDQVARAVEKISGIAGEINLRNQTR